MSKESGFLDMDSNSHKNVVKIVEITTMTLDYINSVHKTAAGLNRIDSDF